MTKILIGVDGSERSEDAVAFGRALALTAGAPVILATAHRSEALRPGAHAHALQTLAEQEDADIIVVGSSHTGRLGRVLPGSTAERLLHGAPCPVAVVPLGYRTRAARSRPVVGCAY